MASGNLIAAVVYDVLQRESFTALADLAEAVKGRCAALHLAYDAGLVSEALHLVERTRPLLGAPRVTNPRHVERIDTVVPLSRAEAADLCRRLGVALGREQAKEIRP
jgi:hypothetical protein